MKKMLVVLAIGAAMAGAALVGWAATGGAGVAPPSGAHGAASMSVQLDALATLMPAKLSLIPPGVDPEIWKARIPEGNESTPERIALGRKLYFETALSKDGTVSCATCHDVTRSFTDRRAVSEGVAGALGRRNAPTTMNVALMEPMFWDGRSASLEEQAGQPILNPVEMAMESKEAAVAAIKAIPAYGPMFKAAYARDVSYADIERAIAAFERTLVFLDAPFDRFRGGEVNAIPADARKGWELFNGKGRCASCHELSSSNPMGTDNQFHNIGVAARHADFESLAREALDELAKDPSELALDKLAVGSDLSELGRFMVTKSYADVGAFRTMPLRNISITAPYMHDGSMETLWDTIDHYNKGGESNPYLDGSIEALALTETEIDQIVAFLFTLTDNRFADLSKAELDRQRALAAKSRPFRDTDLATRKVLGFEKRAKGGD